MQAVRAFRRDARLLLSLVPPRATEETPWPLLDVVLCVDASHSMGSPARDKNNRPLTEEGGCEFTLLDIAKHSLQTLVGILPETARVAVCSFADTARWDVAFTPCTPEGRKEIVTQAMAIQPRGFTNLFGGLRACYEAVAADRASAAGGAPVCHIVLLNDGQPSEWLSPSRRVGEDLSRCFVRNLAPWKTPATTLTCIGFGYDLNSRLMADLGTFLHVPTFGDACAFMVNLAGWLCAAASFGNVPAVDVELLLGDSETQQSRAVAQISVDRTQHHLFDDVEGDEVCVQVLARGQLLGNWLIPVAAPHGDDSEAFDAALAREATALHLREAERAATREEAAACLRRAVEELDADTPLRQTVATEGLLCVETDEAWSSWGQHYLRTLWPMLRAGRRSNFRDAALQEFALGDDGQAGRFEEVVEAGERAFANPIQKIVPSFRRPAAGAAPPPAPRATVLPDEFFRGGGCVHEAARLRVALAHGRVAVKTASSIRAGDLVQTRDSFAAVRLVAKTPWGVAPMVTVEGLVVTPWHPVVVKGTWCFPHDVGPAAPTESRHVYSFVLEGAASFVANGVECAALGHGFPPGHIAHHEYWGDAVVRLMDAAHDARPNDAGVVDMSRICHAERCLLE